MYEIATQTFSVVTPQISSSYLKLSKLKYIQFIIFTCSSLDLIIYRSLRFKWRKLTTVITAFAKAYIIHVKNFNLNECVLSFRKLNMIYRDFNLHRNLLQTLI